MTEGKNKMKILKKVKLRYVLPLIYVVLSLLVFFLPSGIFRYFLTNILVYIETPFYLVLSKAICTGICDRGLSTGLIYFYMTLIVLILYIIGLLIEIFVRVVKNGLTRNS